jgi:hypothetical protein
MSFQLPPFASEEALRACKECAASLLYPTVFVASYPKSGTTWMQAIIFHILSEGKIELTHISDFSPFAELSKTWGIDKARYSQDHAQLGWHLYNTHLRLSDLPSGQNIKYVYVVRSGRDVAVSFFHHLSNQVGDGGLDEGVTFGEFLTDWKDGKVIYGSWLKHLEEWVSHDEKNSILYVRYEALKRDLPRELQRIATFLRPGHSLGEERLRELSTICAFEQMKATKHLYQPVSVTWKTGFDFLRRGEVGDSKSLFGEAENAVFDSMVAQTFPVIPAWLAALDVLS